jgi:hypothetical protein
MSSFIGQYSVITRAISHETHKHKWLSTAINQKCRKPAVCLWDSVTFSHAVCNHTMCSLTRATNSIASIRCFTRRFITPASKMRWVWGLLEFTGKQKNDYDNIFCMQPTSRRSSLWRDLPADAALSVFLRNLSLLTLQPLTVSGLDLQEPATQMPASTAHSRALVMSI